ncbi:FAD:protein FMN transferase [Fuerstiella marisgermanici]|uniref:FAD:protein FMN transferase n=1 Tax=Fuerstiella marisgermanici TaxID=1891926 RepID=A0A1P8WNM6_9PLAN|nr:FAD:protein FMN transferase [Fuerstiella marisgermanici]APZ95651.1 Thiamine biosynthesis lipoprotein ApbE precursor [Fuerstiella marisgermanici]
MAGSSHSRRDFLGALSSKDATETTPPALSVPTGGRTVRISTRAMACEFSIVMNPGAYEQVNAVGDVLELVHEIESWLSIYRPNSEISEANRTAANEAVRVRRPLFELLQTSKTLFDQTQRAFDVAAGAQVKLWRDCRSEQRIPTDDELAEVLQRSGCQHLRLDDEACSVSFDVDGLQLDPGAIGKGHALDEAAAWLSKLDDAPDSFLIHGGHSSLVARGEHEGQGGWPVGIGNPLLTKQRLGTLLLRDKAMSTSGSNIQFFRHEGRRYGHILDPRTARPVAGMLSVTVLADSAAVADALSTAFFVLGVENALKCCDNLDGVAAILIPFPESGRKVRPEVIGVPPEQIFWDANQVSG